MGKLQRFFLCQRVKVTFAVNIYSIRLKYAANNNSQSDVLDCNEPCFQGETFNKCVLPQPLGWYA